MKQLALAASLNINFTLAPVSLSVQLSSMQTDQEFVINALDCVKPAQVNITVSLVLLDFLIVAIAIVHVLLAHSHQSKQKNVSHVNLHAFNAQAVLLTVRNVSLIILLTEVYVKKLVP